MNTQVAKLLAVSVVLNVVGLVIIGDQANQIKRHKDHATRLRTWGKVMSDVVVDQFSRQAFVKMDPKVATDLEAYLIFRQNDMG